MPTVEETTQKVQRILVSEFNGVQLKPDGYSIKVGSTAVHISVHKWRERDDGTISTVIGLWAPIAREIPPSPDLFRWAATTEHTFGAIHVNELDDGTCLASFDHALLGDYLDPDELANAVAAVALTADELDDEAVQRFGGKRYSDA